MTPVLVKRGSHAHTSDTHVTSKIWGPFFLRTHINTPAATYPQVRGFQDLGTPAQKKEESPRGEASRYAGGHRGLQAPRQGLKPPRNSRGSGGRQSPSKNNLMDPEPGFWDQDLLVFWTRIRFWDQDLILFVQRI